MKKLQLLLWFFITALVNVSYGQGSNLISNPGFENGTTGWSAVSCSLSAQSGSPYAGASSCSVTSRSAAWGGPNQDFTSLLNAEGGGKYYVEGYLKTQSGTSTGYLSLKFTISGTTSTIPVSASISTSWTKVSGYINIPQWKNGALTTVQLFATTDGTGNFYADDISVSKVVPEYTNLLTNPSFESGTSGWSNPGCTIAGQSGGYQGATSCLVSARSADWGGPNQSVLSLLSSKGGGVYNLEGWLKTTSGSATAYLTLKLTINGMTTYYGTSGTVSTSWTKVSGKVTIPTWSTGSLTAAELFVSTSGTGNFSVDNCKLNSLAVVPPLAANLIQNPGFETGTGKWNAVGCSFVRENAGQYSGSYLGKVSSRSADWGGPNQNLTNSIAQVGGGTYYLQAWIKTASGTATGNATLKVKVNGVTNYYAVSASIGTSWTKVSGTVTLPTWEVGTLNNAEFFINTSNTANFYVDEIAVSCTNAVPPTNTTGVDPYSPDLSPIKTIEGWNYVWGDEFNYTGAPDPDLWEGERGFIRGQELQYYQIENASVAEGRLLISGKQETRLNEFYDPSSGDYRKNTQYANYTSASILNKNKRYFLLGRIEVRAKIDTTGGNFPAIWTCGFNKDWPHNGEIDIMEYYWTNINGTQQPVLTANFAVGVAQQWEANWDSTFTPLSYYSAQDPQWTYKYHTWRMDWTADTIYLYVDDDLRNTVDINTFKNSDGSIAFYNPQFMILNLAIKGPRTGLATYPTKFEVDYFRVYQQIVDVQKPTKVLSLAASNITANSCKLTWAASSDNNGVYRYDIYKNGEADGYFIGSTTNTYFDVTGLSAGVTNNFIVKALDHNGNYSDNSSLSVTQSGNPAGRFGVSPEKKDDGGDMGEGFLVYPEKNTIRIDNGSVGMEQVDIFDLQGRLLYSEKIPDIAQAEISGLAAQRQVLLIVITTAKGKVTKRIIY